MAQFIENPRRAPRAPIRCRAVVVSHTGSFECETEDISSRGCQLVSTKFMRKGDVIQLTVTNDKVPEPLHVAGHVAWVSAQAPFRVGIAFDEPSVREGTRWFERVLAAYPGLAGFHRVPDRIPTDATVYLGPPPRFLLDFSPDEASLLRAIGSGTRIDELQARLRDRWPAAQLALFSLLARQAVTLVRGHAFQPDAWKKVLAEVEAALAVESLGKFELAAPVASPTPPPRPAAASAPARRAEGPSATPVPVPQRKSPGQAPAPAATPAVPPWETRTVQNPSRMLDLPDDDGPPLEIDTRAPLTPARTAEAGHDPGTPGEPAARGPKRDFKGAGVGWRTARARSAEAQGVFDHALAEIHAGNTSAALALLRKALQLAPGDPEIAGALGKLAFKDRGPGTG